MNKIFKPGISFNLRKSLIRIHKDTLYSIGNPYYVLLLVNPNERTIAVHPTDSSDTRAHHISRSSIINGKSFEIYSMPLVKNLLELCPNWEQDKTYRIAGEKVPNQAIVIFKMTDAISIYK